ncbi:MAG: virulence protein RhuM/Fic/DOC family protein [bacterium]|nr:virulence protein RhuM/Fic/DOC family protein [bacterium]
MPTVAKIATVQNIYKISMAKKEEKIVIYRAKSGDIKVSTHFVDETIWLTQQELSTLFDIDRTVITKHLNNIFKTGELEEKSNVHFLHIANSDKPVKMYNLDAIISVGYRVNSKKATDFRVWATTTLRNYLTKGYVINQKQLETVRKNFLEARQLLLLIGEKAKSELLQGHEKDLLDLVGEYAKTLELLEEYDQGDIKISKSKNPVKFEISYDGALELVGRLKENLARLKLNVYFFGTENGEKLRSIIGAVNQTFGGEDLYQGVATKAANLFYLVIKDHPFTDGNKRIASVLFLYFLGNNSFLYKKSGENKITNSTLAVLALLVAASDPKEKETIVSLVIKLLEEF